MLTATKELFTRPSGVSYQISRSVRLRASATAYFNRTPASATNRQIWTWSGWVKRSRTGQNDPLFDASNNAATTSYGIRFENTDVLQVIGYVSGFNYNLETTQVFRDPSAWYHIIVAFDDTQATASNRVKVYVNGLQVTAFTTATYPAQNTNYLINDTVQHRIGSAQFSSQYFDGYMTEINFIDGQALTASSFGSTNAATGVWSPIKYTGTYGTNGYYLNFSDNSSNTATTIGKDNSGNGNNWTPNNISVTTGVTYDSMLDVPTPYADTGNGRGNYPVMNPLVVTSYTYANGNLTLTNSVANWFNTKATIPFGSTGKFYYEQVCTSGLNCWAGIGNENTLLSGNPAGYDANSYGYGNDGNKATNSIATAYGSTFTTNDVISVAFDTATGSVWFAKNGTWQNSGVPASGTGYAFTGITGTMFPIGSSSGAGATVVQSYNFGQRPFSYTPPTGFVALNTQNLPTPTISNGAAYMAATLYTGNGSTQTITNTVNSISFQPDLVWYKDRSVAREHSWFDSVRGVTKGLASSNTAAENTFSGLTAFNINGFDLGSNINGNASAETYVAWQWNAGTTSASNTNGSITSTVSVNATAGFSVVTFNSNATAGATVGHGLGVAPSMFFVKSRSIIGDWGVYHASVGNTGGLLLDTTVAVNTTVQFWNNTSPTSSVFTLGNGSTVNPTSGTNMVAYCFAAVAGYSKFGSYTGNGSTDGPFVYTGFRPRFIMVKCSSNSTSSTVWTIWDTSRSPYNASVNELTANSSAAEGVDSSGIDILSNGFKPKRNSEYANLNGWTYIYAAFAENPFKYSLAR